MSELNLEISNIISTDDIEKNYNTFRNIINETFTEERLDRLNKLYDDYTERLSLSPASSYEHFHNAFAGGYCDHVLRVITYAKAVFKLWTAAGLITDNFTMEELIFAAMHHDLGKLGFPGDDYDSYLYNKSDWHRKNQGKLYELSGKIPYGEVADKSTYILQKYGIETTWNEYMGIRLCDGIYDESNKPYFMGFNLENKFRCNIVSILHQADYMAARFEFERWVKLSNKNKNFNFKPLKEWETKKETIFKTPGKVKPGNTGFEDFDI